MEILDPVGDVAPGRQALARRPAGLDGVAIGLLDNSKPNAGALLEGAVRAALARGAVGPRVWRKPASSGAASPALLDEIAGACGVVLTGSAD